MISVPTGYRPVDVPQERHRDLLVTDAWAFPSSITVEQASALPSPLTWERTRGVEAEDGELVAVHSSYPFARFPVPGGQLPVSGLTWVGVHPGHRRRGLLRAMVEEHFRRSLDRGEPVSALFAAEMAIYGRFGYGLAARDLRMTVPRGAALRDVAGSEQVRVRLELLDPARHDDVVHRLHASVDRPGWATRESSELRTTFLSDPEHWRGGAETLRIALAERDGEMLGYALFRRKEDWQPAGPRGVVRVRELVARDAAVSRALWGVLLDLDLTATVETPMLPVDDALTHLLVDTRAAVPRVSDNVWVRLLDLPAALGGRRYAVDVDVVLATTDPLLPDNAGRWRLVGGPDGAEVTRTDAAADLSLDVRELGAAYLGGVSLASLATAGLVTEHSAGALARTAPAFGWPLAPVCGWVF